ncbi:hypothetical protein THAOC_23051, partial [Thalassiosira oceanica]
RSGGVGRSPEAQREGKKKKEEEERRGGEEGLSSKQTLIVRGNEFTPGSSGSGQSAVLSHQ